MKATQSSLPLTGQPVGVEVSDGAAPVASGAHGARRGSRGRWSAPISRCDITHAEWFCLGAPETRQHVPGADGSVLVPLHRPCVQLQLIIGLFLWDFFAESTKVGMGSLHAKAFLFKKMRVPLWVLVLSSIANPLITLGVFGVVIVAFLTAAGQPPSPHGIALFATCCGAR